ncbi:MAG TPA: hypothetical protein VF323_01380, partial [Candidatus Limnocylindrales bacterium]
TGLTAPTHARGTFIATWTATDNLGVTGYQTRTKHGAAAWATPLNQTARSKVFTLSSGTWTIAVRAKDAAANWSAWRQMTISVDASAPVMTRLSAPYLVRSMDGSFVVSFAASDNVGVTRYYVRTKKGATGAWSAGQPQSGRSRTFTGLSAGTWYIGVTAQDAVGNAASWHVVRVVVPTDDRAYHFSLGTVHLRSAADFKGTETATSRPGATMTIKFTGSAFYLIGTTGIHLGRMRVTIDGVSKTVDEGTYAGRRATTTHHRVLLFAKGLVAGPHTVVITNLGTSGRPTISVDAIGLRN